MNRELIVGHSYGRWLIIGLRDGALIARCACGVQRTLTAAQTWNVFYGHSRSCGCLSREKLPLARRKHGESQKTPEYQAWTTMKGRCNNPKSPRFKYYGARGIRVCDQWLADFASFLSDMGRRPSQKHSIDRIDNDGPYSPENCRWATQTEQLQNTRHNNNLTFNGRTQSVTKWAREYGIPRHRFSARIHAGWPIEKALMNPPGEGHRRQFRWPANVSSHC